MSDTTGACEKMGSHNSDIPEWVWALEPVRHLPTNTGSRIKRCVYDALKIGPPTWARERLEYSISKEVYKANASGPTKRAVLSVLADVSKDLHQHSQNEMKKKFDLSIFEARLRRIVWRRAALKVYDFDKFSPDQSHSAASMIPKLDFRDIDCKLAVEAYGRSQKAFLRDVQELWNNLRTAHAEQPPILQLVDRLSQSFDSVYEKEVLDPVKRLKQYRKSVFLSEEVENEVDNILGLINEMPIAPWNSGRCKVCNLDKDDNLVLLCDICDGEYHTYCLTPPCTVPEGNWYCPLCVSQFPPRLLTEKYKGEGSSKKLGCIDAEVEAKEDPETAEDKIVICEICGDVGFTEAIISCCKCEAAFVHGYCVYDGSTTFKWECEDCVIESNRRDVGEATS